MSQQEMQPATKRGFSLRSMLLLVLLVGVGAGATAYAVGSAFATKRSVTDINGSTHWTIEGPIQWIVVPQGANSAKICIGTFTASKVLF